MPRTFEEYYIVSNFRYFLNDRPLYMPDDDVELVNFLEYITLEYFEPMGFGQHMDLVGEFHPMKMLSVVKSRLYPEVSLVRDEDFFDWLHVASFVMVVFEYQHLLTSEENQKFMEVIGVVAPAKKTFNKSPQIVDSSSDNEEGF